MKIFKRPPDRIIGENYLLRWYIIPRNRFLNIYLHCFLGSDDDRALHDHPWWSLSFLLKGKINEITLPMNSIHCWNCTKELNYRKINRFVPVFRSAKHAHRIDLKSDKAWTLFITGPKVREWGFLCPGGWRHWREFTDRSGNNVGRGCD